MKFFLTALCVLVLSVDTSAQFSYAATKESIVLAVTDDNNATAEPLVASMLIQINDMHQAFFTNFSRLWHFADLFTPNGTWWMPVGLYRDGDMRYGPEEILKSLQGFSGLLKGERSWMTDVIISGYSGAYWWRDVYLTPSGCMFSSLGYNQFFIDPPTQLISAQNTWMDVQDGQVQGLECGLSYEAFTQSPYLADVYNTVRTALTNISSEESQNFPALFAENATFWEPVGVDSGKLFGQEAIAEMWGGALSTFQAWTNVLIHDPIYAGLSVGVDLVLSFVTMDGCPYSIREFIAIMVDDDGFITDFQVHYDRNAAVAARAVCGM